MFQKITNQIMMALEPSFKYDIDEKETHPSNLFTECIREFIEFLNYINLPSKAQEVKIMCYVSKYQTSAIILVLLKTLIDLSRTLYKNSQDSLTFSFAATKTLLHMRQPFRSSTLSKEYLDPHSLV